MEEVLFNENFYVSEKGNTLLMSDCGNTALFARIGPFHFLVSTVIMHNDPKAEIFGIVASPEKMRKKIEAEYENWRVIYDVLGLTTYAEKEMLCVGDPSLHKRFSWAES